MSASRSSVAHNYFRPSLRILFTAFLETKPQLWKLISAISGCCIGSRGSPLHPPLHPLTNFEVQKFYQNEPKFNGLYSRNNLLNIKDEAYVIYLGEFKSIGTHLIALYVNGNNIIYFDSFGVNIFQKKL